MTQPPLPPEPPDDDVTVVRPAARRYDEYEAVAPAPVGPPPDRRVGAGMLLALGALALIALGILIAYLLTHRHHKKSQPTTVVVTTQVTTQAATTVASSVSVPHLVGLKEADALVRLGQLGLKPREVFQATKKPTRLVVSQNPAEATKVAKGSTVKLVIDQGAPAHPATTTVPGTTTVTTTAATTAPTATTAPATTTAPAKTTTAVAPTTPKSATVPDVSGQTEQAAVNAFNSAGILPSLVFVPGSSPLGTVVEQAKPSGTTVPYHSHVQINLSKGPNAATDESVPNAVGQTLKQAVSTMNSAHLRLIYVKFPVTSKTQAGKTVQQTPGAGAKAPQNAQILVFLGAFQG